MTLLAILALLQLSNPAGDAEKWRRYDLVRVTVNADQVRRCRSLGLVEPPRFVPADPEKRGHDQGHREVKWSAMEAGGDTVLLTATVAEGYRCASPKSPKKRRVARTSKARP